MPDLSEDVGRMQYPSGMGDTGEESAGLEVGSPSPEQVLEGLPGMPLRMLKLIEWKAERHSMDRLKDSFNQTATMSNLRRFVDPNDHEEGSAPVTEVTGPSLLLITVLSAAPMLRLMKEEADDSPDYSKLSLTGRQRNELATLVEELDVLQGIFEGTDDSGSNDASSDSSDPALRGKLGFSARHFGTESLPNNAASDGTALFGSRHA